MFERGDVRQAVGEVGVVGGRLAFERHEAPHRVAGDRTVREDRLAVAILHLQQTLGDGDVRTAQSEGVTLSV